MHDPPESGEEHLLENPRDGDVEALKLHIERPERADDAPALPVRDALFIEGWALARCGGVAVDIAIDGNHAGSATYGRPRPDVAAAHPGWEDARNSGFLITIPARSLPPGRHSVHIVARDNDGHTKEAAF